MLEIRIPFQVATNCTCHDAASGGLIAWRGRGACATYLNAGGWVIVIPRRAPPHPPIARHRNRGKTLCTRGIYDIHQLAPTCVGTV
jgi:hypothetical protein